jgi:hypothetical protein
VRGERLAALGRSFTRLVLLYSIVMNSIRRQLVLLLVDIASVIVLLCVSLTSCESFRACTWTRWACVHPWLGTALIIFTGSNTSAACLSSVSATASSLFVLHNSLLCLPKWHRVVSGSGHVILQASLCVDKHEPWSFLASFTVLALSGAIVCFGEILGVALLEFAMHRVADAVEHTSREAEVQHRENSNSLANLAPTIGWERVEMLHQIGHGAFGSVHAVKYLGTIMAMKIVHKGKCDEATLKAECQLMLTLRHPHVLQTIGLVRRAYTRAPTPHASITTHLIAHAIMCPPPILRTIVAGE